MPIYFYERSESRPFELSGSGVTLTRHCFLSGTSDETLVYLTALLQSPIIYDNLVRDGIRAEDQGGGNWYVDIAYRNIDPQQALGGTDPNNPGGPGGSGGSTSNPSGPETPTENLQPSWSVDTSGQTVRVFQSLGTMEKKSITGSDDTDATRLEAAGLNQILDNQRAIGLSATGVEGTDKYVPRVELVKKCYRDNVNVNYIKTVRELTGKVNDAVFCHFEPREILYLGAVMNQGNGRWDVTHKFAMEKNQTNVQVSDGITLQELRGWEYIWCRYIMGQIPPYMVQIPGSAYVEKLYEEGDFSLLQIGT